MPLPYNDAGRSKEDFMKLSKHVMAILGLAALLAGVTTFGSCQTPPPASQAHIKTVFLILMENKNWVQILGSSSAPYINNTLLPMASHAELYFNPPWFIPACPTICGSKPASTSASSTTTRPARITRVRPGIW